MLPNVAAEHCQHPRVFAAREYHMQSGLIVYGTSMYYCVLARLCAY